MSRNASRYGGRYREPRSRPAVARWEWHYAGRVAVVVEVTRRGAVLVTVPHPERVSSVGREMGAFWANELMPRLSNDEVYAVLWGNA